MAEHLCKYWPGMHQDREESARVMCGCVLLQFRVVGSFHIVSIERLT